MPQVAKTGPKIAGCLADESLALLKQCNFKFWNTMEELKALAASSILVLPIERMLG